MKSYNGQKKYVSFNDLMQAMIATIHAKIMKSTSNGTCIPCKLLSGKR